MYKFQIKPQKKHREVYLDYLNKSVSFPEALGSEEPKVRCDTAIPLPPSNVEDGIEPVPSLSEKDKILQHASVISDEQSSEKSIMKKHGNSDQIDAMEKGISVENALLTVDIDKGLFHRRTAKHRTKPDYLTQNSLSAPLALELSDKNKRNTSFLGLNLSSSLWPLRPATSRKPLQSRDSLSEPISSAKLILRKGHGTHVFGREEEEDAVIKDDEVNEGDDGLLGGGSADEVEEEEEEDVLERGYDSEDEEFLHPHQKGKLAGVESVESSQSRMWSAAGLEGRTVRR